MAAVPPEPDLALAGDLGRLLAPERVLTRALDRLARSADASIYRLIPQAVVRPRGLAEVKALLAYANARGRHLTFRAAGTSLSGQAVSDDLLVELAPYWQQFRILDGGRRVFAEPGVVGGLVNRRLAPLGYRLGPDPASLDAAMLGGILANNSSGMCCGTRENAYRTLEALHFVLAGGTEVDTARPHADARLRAQNPALHAAVLALRDKVRGDAELTALIRRRFALKNTTAYSLQSFLDHEEPAQILAHLMVGSQGTLGFVAGMTLRTVPEPPARATALLYFGELAEAGAAVFPLAEAGAAALEIMDSRSLRSQAAERAYPFALDANVAALLVELRAADAAELAAQEARALEALARFRLLEPPRFATEAAVRDEHWRLRKALFPAVGGMRPPGTAVVIEDVAVPVARLAEAVVDLQALFARHELHEAIVFGHARDGNLHFVLARDYADPAEVARYARLMRELVDLIVGKYDGSLKAEHGSGRNMAPFVRDEWGEQAWRLMWRLKRLLDPRGILNPGVVLTEDPELHLRDLKALPTITPLADRCIECGFCEPRCPSRELTVTPRQRIVAVRALAALEAAGTAQARAWREEIEEDYAYQGIATCARDSMCSTSCPVKIDTGAMVKEMLVPRRKAPARALARWLAGHYGAAAALARAGLRAVAVLDRLPGGRAALATLTRELHLLSPELLPQVPADVVLPRPARALGRPPASHGEPVVYFPSCLTRIFGPLPDARGEVALGDAVADVLTRAGFAVTHPAGLDGLCCGMPFSSKAFPDAALLAAARTAEALWSASGGGRAPVVTDTSPCAGTLHELVKGHLATSGRTLELFDFPGFWARRVLPVRPPAVRRAPLAVLHPTCTLIKLGGLPDLLAVARAHAERAVVPAAAECCGFAGDRGFVVPELTRSATRAESGEVKELLAAEPEAGLYSTCRTCEMGMSWGVGRPYRSLVHLVRETMT